MRIHIGRIATASFYLCTVLLFAASCSTPKKTNATAETKAVEIEFNADSAYAFCAAQCQFGPRVMNSEAHEQCGAWIGRQFEQYGYSVSKQQATLTGYDGTPLRATNLIARHADSIPQAGRRILVCAHWDSRPWADNDPDEANWHQPVMAANDGASGVAVMLELARLIQQHDSLNVAVDFLCFDAEDWGTPQWSDIQDDGNTWALGAQHWATHYDPQRDGRYDYAILLDMVGGQGAHFYREGFSVQYAAAIVDRIWRAAQTAGYGSLFPNQTGGYITDDHVPLNQTAQIPTVDIINHYPDCQQSSFGPTWHTVSDDMQHIDRNTLRAVGQTLVQLLFTE
ncbi:MAG: M28 family peptidase [Prevotella sp.]|nr:M28 family peptidase [Prevotella sp.]